VVGWLVLGSLGFLLAVLLCVRWRVGFWGRCGGVGTSGWLEVLELNVCRSHGLGLGLFWLARRF